MTRAVSKLAVESPGQLQPGSLVDGYGVERVLSVDAGNRMLVSALSPNGDRVAIRLLGVAARDTQQRQRIASLVRARASVEHPNLARLLGAGEHEGRLYLVSELAATRTLADRLGEGPLPPDEAITVLAGIAGALTAASREGLHHAELSPHAIFLAHDRPAHALLTDFGIGRAPSGRPDLRLSVETADYLPPEEIRGEQLTPRSNSYSLACILFECLSGTPPYPYERPLLTLHAHLVEPPPRPSDLPAELHEVMAQALSKEPGQRFDCLALVEAAGEALGIEVEIPRPVAAPQKPAPARPKVAVAKRPRAKVDPRPKAAAGPRPARAKPSAPKPARAPRPARARQPTRPSQQRQRRRTARRPSMALAVAAALLASAAGGFVLGSPSGEPGEPAGTVRAQPQPDATKLARAEYARGLSPVINRLSERRAAARRRLRRADHPERQAQAARALAAAYADARKALSGEPPQSLEGGGLDAQLRSAERAYRRLGAAALRDNRRAWRSASRTAIEQERRLERSLGTLTSA